MSAGPRSHRAVRARRTAVGGVLLAGALTALGGLPATAAPTPAPGPPQLSIAVDNGQTSVDAGDRLTYTMTVTNLGGREVSDLRLSQTVPAGTSLVSADRGGEERSGAVQWNVDLAAAKTVTVRTTLSLASTPETVLRLATVACAAVEAKGPPVVCASDSDLLPAGAAAQQAAPPAPAAGDRRWWYAGGGVGLVGLAAVATAAVVRRRRIRSEPTQGEPA